MNLPGSSGDVELGQSVNKQQTRPPRPRGTEGIKRGSAPTSGELGRRRTPASASTCDHQTPPRDAASGGVSLRSEFKLPDTEIELVWKFTNKNTPCPSGTDDVEDRWKLLELAEKFWKEEVTDITSRLDRAKDDVSSTNNELYQILGFYSVFQGLLVGAACQSKTLTCEKRVPLFVLCAITTAYAVVGLLLKFQDFHGKQIYAEEQQQKRNQRKAQITKLRRENLGFQFATPTSKKEPSKVRIWIIRFALVLMIFAFSGTVIGCIQWILC